MSWLHPYSLKMILAHAKDTYLYKRNPNAAKEILEEYDLLLAAYKEYPEWLDLPEEWQNDFNQMHGEIQILLHRIESNLDYFGNPAGWVPMLSFEVTKAIYEKEIEHAIRVLYLSYWLGNGAGSIQQKINNMSALRDRLKQEITNFKQQYDAAVTMIPELQSDSVAISNRVDFLQQQIQAKENELVLYAEQNVEERHKVPTWKKIAQVAGTICKLCPVYQPALGAIGTGLDIAAKYDPDNPWETIQQIPDITKAYKSSDFASKAKSWDETWTAFEAASFENDSEDYLEKLKNVGEQFSPMGKELVKMKDKFDETKIPKNEVEAELQKLKAESPEFTNLVQDIQKLMAQKEEFARNLADAMQKVTVMADNITLNILAADKLTQDITKGKTVLDQRALSYLEEMERRAKSRLLKYHYYLAKAYEYRMLQQYTGDLNLQSLFDKFLELGENSSGGILDDEQFSSLKNTYYEELHNIEQSIVDSFQSHDSSLQWRDGNFTITLSEDQIDLLNQGESVFINPISILASLEDNLRIKDMSIFPHGIEAHSTSGTLSDFYVSMFHSGVSVLESKGEVFQFKHFNAGKQKPLLWRLHFNATRREVTEEPISSATSSLILSLVDSGNVNRFTEVYSSPAVWADIEIKTEQKAPNVAIGKFTFDMTYTYAYKDRSRSSNVIVLPPEEGFLPYITSDTGDKNSRKDGMGMFYRSYEQGRIVKLKAPERYGVWEFDKWVDNKGNYEIGSTPELSLTMYSHYRNMYDSSIAIRPVYRMASGEDILLGDLNDDGFVTLEDVILGLKIVGGVDLTGQRINLKAEVNGDGRIGIPEAVYILREVTKN